MQINMKSRRKSTPQKQITTCKRIPRKGSDTSNILVPYKAKPVPTLLSNSRRVDKYPEILPLENCYNIQIHRTGKETSKIPLTNVLTSPYVSGEQVHEYMRGETGRINNKCELDYTEVPCPTVEYCSREEKSSDNILNVTEPMNKADMEGGILTSAKKEQFPQHANCREELSFSQNSHSLQEALRDPQKLVSIFEEACPLLRGLSDGYTTLKRKYGLLYKRNQERMKELDRLNKKADQQADRITKIISALTQIQNENSVLKAQHNTFLLYKKEVGKYIESFKSNLELKEGEIRSLHEKNDKLECEILSGEHKCEKLENDVHEKSVTIEILEQENWNVKNQIDGLRKRICEVEDSMNSQKYKYIRRNLNKLVENKAICETVMGVMKSRLCNLSVKIHEIAQIQSVLVAILFSQIKENICMKSCIKEAGGIFRKISSKISAGCEKILEIRSLEERLTFYIRSVCAMHNEKMGALYSIIGPDGLCKLKSIIKCTGTIASKIESCKTAGMSTVLLKKHYAGLMANQRKRFEEQKTQYERIIGDLKKGNDRDSEESDKSDIWDIFQGR